MRLAPLSAATVPWPEALIVSFPGAVEIRYTPEAEITLLPPEAATVLSPETLYEDPIVPLMMSTLVPVKVDGTAPTLTT